MTRLMRLRACVAAMALMTVCAAGVSPLGAQELPAERRLPLLTGGAVSTPDQRLDLSVSVLAGVADDDASDFGRGFGRTAPQERNTYESLGLQLGYVRKFQLSTLAVAGRGVGRYFQGAGGRMHVQPAVSGGYDFRRRGTRVLLEHVANQFPLFAAGAGIATRLFSTGLAELPAVASDDASVAMAARRYSTSASFAQEIGVRFALTAEATAVYTTVNGGAATLRQNIGLARLTYRLTRDVGIIGGYRGQQGAYRFAAGGGPTRVDVHDIDLGLAYDRPLSFSRRTRMGFSVRPVAIRDLQGRSMRYAVGGEARVNRELGRTWQGTAGFSRGVTFVDGFTAPFFGDTIAVSVSGNLQRRVAVTLGGDYWSGRATPSAGGEAAADRSRRATATGRIDIALSPTAVFIAEYRYFHSRFDAAAVPVIGLARQIDRSSLRVGVDVRLPLLP
jgi:hypothetical protein